MIRVLMIGNFLSKTTGTKGTSEKILNFANFKNIKFIGASNKAFRIFRFVEIVLKSVFSRYDVIHSDTFSDRAFILTEATTFIGKIRQKKVILSLHGGKLPEFYMQYSERLKRTLFRADTLKTPSLYLISFFKDQGIELNYLPNSIELSRFPYDRSSVVSHSLLWVRAFSSIYNPSLAILALNEVRKIYQDATLTMIGPDKGLLPQIKKLVFDLEIENAVKIIGPVKNEKLFSFYQTHEVYLNTTSYESFGIALIEAASCGIPIVSTNVGEIPYLYTHRENIMMVNNFDPVAFADQIIQIFESSLLAESLSKNARKLAEHFDWNIIKAQWLEILSV